jgi:hypothetical protein
MTVFGHRVLTAMPSSRNSSAIARAQKLIPNFAERVGDVRPEPARVGAGRRRVVEDVRVLRLLEMRDAGLGAEERAPGVDPVHQVPLLHRGLERARQMNGARVVHQDVDAPEALHRLLHRGVDLILEADVHHAGERPAPAFSISSAAV